MSQRFRKPSHHSSKLVVHIRQRRLLPPNLHIHFPIHHRSQSTLPYVPVLWVLTAREDFMDIQAAARSNDASAKTNETFLLIRTCEAALGHYIGVLIEKRIRDPMSTCTRPSRLCVCPSAAES